MILVFMIRKRPWAVFESILEIRRYLLRSPRRRVGRFQRNSTLIGTWIPISAKLTTKNLRSKSGKLWRVMVLIRVINGLLNNRSMTLSRVPPRYILGKTTLWNSILPICKKLWIISGSNLDCSAIIRIQQMRIMQTMSVIIAKSKRILLRIKGTSRIWINYLHIMIQGAGLGMREHIRVIRPCFRIRIRLLMGHRAWRRVFHYGEKSLQVKMGWLKQTEIIQNNFTGLIVLMWCRLRGMTSFWGSIMI